MKYWYSSLWWSRKSQNRKLPVVGINIFYRWSYQIQYRNIFMYNTYCKPTLISFTGFCKYYLLWTIHWMSLVYYFPSTLPLEHENFSPWTSLPPVNCEIKSHNKSWLTVNWQWISGPTHKNHLQDSLSSGSTLCSEMYFSRLVLNSISPPNLFSEPSSIRMKWEWFSSRGTFLEHANWASITSVLEYTAGNKPFFWPWRNTLPFQYSLLSKQDLQNVTYINSMHTIN